MKKKVLVAIAAMAIAAMAVMMTACSSSSSSTSASASGSASASSASASASSASASASSAAASSKHIVVGTAGTGEPYSAVSDSGKWTGIEADLWDEVAKRTGWDIEMKNVADMSSLFGELETGRVDVAANCFAITQKRLDKYLASDPIYGDAQVIIVKPESSYQTFEDLRGKTVGVTAGQASQSTVEEKAPEYDWEVITYEDSNAGFQDTSLGRIESYANTVTNIEKAEKAQGLEFRMLDEKLFGNNVGWWFQDSSEGAELRDELNKVLDEMMKDGTVSKILTNWFGEDMTKYISNDYLTATK